MGVYACPTYAKISAGAMSLGGSSYINITGGAVWTQVITENVTNEASGTAATFETGRYWREAAASGHYYVSGAWPKPLGTSPANTLFSEIGVARIVRRTELEHTSGPSTPQGFSCWSPGVHTYSGSLIGWLKASETPVETGTISLTGMTLPLSPSVSVAGDAVLRFVRYRTDFARGTAVPIQFSYSLSNTVTLGSNNPFSATSYTTTLTLDNGQDWAGTLIPRELTALINYTRGTPARLSTQAPFSGTVTFT